MSGMTNTSRDISSMRLFCSGVPVRSSFLMDNKHIDEILYQNISTNYFSKIRRAYLDARTLMRFS